MIPIYTCLSSKLHIPPVGIYSILSCDTYLIYTEFFFFFLCWWGDLFLNCYFVIFNFWACNFLLSFFFFTWRLRINWIVTKQSIWLGGICGMSLCYESVLPLIDCFVHLPPVCSWHKSLFPDIIMHKSVWSFVLSTYMLCKETCIYFIYTLSDGWISLYCII